MALDDVLKEKKKGFMMNKLVFGIAALFATLAMVHAAPVWTTGPNNCDTWRPDLRNVFLDATVTSGYGGLANRSVAAGETSVYSKNVVTFTLAKTADISAINFYSHHTDGGCDGICTLSIEVKQGDTWSTLENSAVEYGTKRIDGNNNGKGTTNGSLKGLFANADGSVLATGVSAVRINFGDQDNGVTLYGEIEAIGNYTDKTRRLTVAAVDADFGTITVSPTSDTGWYAEDSNVTVTFNPATSVGFLKWSGDVTSEQSKSASITLKMDGSRSIRSYAYSSTWIYKNSKLSDGLRTFNASLSDNNVTITGVSDLGGTNIVDLSLPIRDSRKLVTIKGDSTMKSVKTLYLPDTLTTIGNRVFVSSAVTKVIPFLPDSLTSLGGGAFADAGSLSGSLRLGYATNSLGESVQTVIQVHDGTRSIAFQGPALGPVVDLGPGVTDILPYFANNCGNVTNLYLGGALTRIANDAFAGLGASKKVDITFVEDAPATFSATAFGSKMTSQKMRFFLPWTGEETYPRWGAFITNETLVTPWKKLDPTVRQAYRTAFPSAQYGTKNPYGLTTESAPLNTLPLPANQWIMATIAAEAGAWVTGPYDATTWQASTSNVLVGASRSESTPAALANGQLDTVSADGNIANAQVCTWTLPGRVVLYGFNFYTHAADGHRDGIHVAKIEVQSFGSEDWTELDVPEVEFGTANLDGGDVPHGGVVGTYKASYFRNNRSQLASDVVAVRVTFGNPQDNGASCYAEVEAIGVASGWTLRVVEPMAEFGSCTCEPPSETGAYPAGTTVRVTFTPADGVTFKRWTGDVAEEDNTNMPLVVKLTQDITLTPKIVANFLVYKSGHLLDGDEDLSASGEKNAITVTGRYAFGENGMLDLNKPIYGGGKIVAIGEKAFEGSSKRPTTVRLPDTIETLGNRCFCQCGYFNLETGMDFPSLVNCGGASFIQDYLGKSVKVGFAKDADGNYRDFTFVLHSGDTRSIAFESCSVGPDIILGPGVTVIPPSTFNYSDNVTNLWLGTNISSIQGSAFSGIGKKAATITFEGDLPTTIVSTAFGTPTAYKVRIRPLIMSAASTARDSRWRALIEDASKVTPWAQLTDAQRTAYTNNFPRATYGNRKPYGLTTASATLGSATLPANVWITDEGRRSFVLTVR